MELVNNSIVKSTVTNEAETWKCNKNLESKFTSMEMDFFKIGEKFKIRKNANRDKINIKNLVIDYVSCKQLNWYDHMQRMNKEGLPLKILECVPK